jgi:lysyl endopeptidase
MKKNLFSLLTFSFCIALSSICYSQLSEGGTPMSFQKKLIVENVPIADMPSFDVGQMLKEDETLHKDKTGPFRFGKNFETAYTLQNSGKWISLENGDRIWQLAIRSEGAYSINLTYDYFYLPEGAKFYIYNQEKDMVLGAFTSKNNHPERVFATDLVKGDHIILEYYEPKAVAGKGSILISIVTHAYRDLINFDKKNFGSSGACNINVACPLGLDWQDQISSVLMMVSGGNGFCTGALVNNTSNDGTPYFLTANHCGSSGFGSWIFRFNWESSTCNNPSSSPTFQSLTGAVSRANNGGSDFRLLELNNSIPANYNAYFSGWSNINTPSTSSIGIHHPSGDIKKISRDADPTTSATFSGVDSWKIGAWEQGTTEPGSSGSPLYDQNQRIIGQLYGGSASCSQPNSPDYYGKFSTSWDGASASTRLKDWLDPLNTGTQTLDGYNPNASTVNIDAGISNILSPVSGSNSCETNYVPSVVLRNYGMDTLKTVTISYQINAGPINTYSWSGILASGFTQTINLSAITAITGVNTFTVFTSNPNGQNDQNTTNDSRTINFTVLPPPSTLALPFNEGFENITFPPVGWVIQNADNNKTWERNDTIGGFGLSNASAWLNNFTYDGSGQSDFLISPALNFTNAVSPVKLEFSLAYARYSSTYHDSLIISVSSDCAGSWQRLYAKGNNVLATAGTVTQTFFPQSNQWRRETVDLSNYIGYQHLYVRFENITGYGNNIFIDDIHVYDSLSTTAQRIYKNENDILIYPNPSNGEFYIHFSTVYKIQDSFIRVYNLLGELVLEKRTNDASEVTRIDISHAPSGIYIVQIDGEFTTSRKIVKR